MKSQKNPNEPDRRKGGTFIRDKQGNLVKHIAPTQDLRAGALPPRAAPKNEDVKGK
jgi:hypothetical protein